jgi:hypothetical protein
LKQNEGKTASIYFRYEVKRRIWKQIEAKRKIQKQNEAKRKICKVKSSKNIYAIFLLRSKTKKLEAI